VDISLVYDQYTENFGTQHKTIQCGGSTPAWRTADNGNETQHTPARTDIWCGERAVKEQH
jgi:hypothetical protein